MSKICVFCGKSYQKGNLVPRGIGNRVTNRAITHQNANLRNKRININGTSLKVKICSSCLKRMKFEQKKIEKAAETVSTSVK